MKILQKHFVKGNKKLIIGLFFCLCLPPFQGCARMVAGEGVDTLIDLKKDEAKKQEILKGEDLSFRMMKDAVQKERLKKGMNPAEVRRVSAPVLIVPEGGGARWVYAGKKTGWVSGPKIYLFFDGFDHLISWECIRIDGGCE